MLLLNSPESEWLCGLYFDPADNAHLSLQRVSGFHSELYSDLAGGACSWFSRM